MTGGYSRGTGQPHLAEEGSTALNDKSTGLEGMEVKYAVLETSGGISIIPRGTA